jgi:hypothetical protein
MARTCVDAAHGCLRVLQSADVFVIVAAAIIANLLQ